MSTVIFCFSCDKACAATSDAQCKCGHAVKGGHSAPRAGPGVGPSKSSSSSAAAPAAAALPFQAVKLKSTGVATAPAAAAAASKPTPSAAAPSSAAPILPLKKAQTTAPAAVKKDAPPPPTAAAAKKDVTPAPAPVPAPAKKAESSSASGGGGFFSSMRGSIFGGSKAPPAVSPSSPNPAALAAFHSSPEFASLQRQHGTFMCEGTVSKRAHANRHKWDARFLVLFSKALVYAADRPTLASHPAQARIIKVDEMESVAVATDGKGSKEGARFNLQLVGGLEYQWIAEGPGDVRVAAKDWADKLNKCIAERPRPSTTPNAATVTQPTLPTKDATSSTTASATVTSSKASHHGHEEDAAPSFTLIGKQVLAEGIVSKKSTFSRHLWQVRWFVLTREALVYYPSQKERSANAEPAKVISCDLIKAVDVPTAGKGTDSGLRFNLELEATSRVFELQADVPLARDHWVNHLRKVIGARSEAFVAQQRQAETERLAALDRVRSQAEREKAALTSSMRATMDAEVARLQAEHAARLDAQSEAARAAQEQKERVLKADSERLTTERDAKIAQLEAERSRLEKHAAQAQGQAQQAAASDARASEEHAAALARVRADLAAQKEEALLQARLEQEAALQASRAEEQAKLARMAKAVEEERRQAEAKAKAAYQTQAAALKASFEQEKEAERAERERQQQASEKRIIEQYERELEARKADIARKAAEASAALEHSLAADASAAATVAASAEREAAARKAAERLAQAQVDAEREARAKLEAELLALQEAQDRRTREHELATAQKRDQQTSALKDQFKNQLNALQQSLESQLKTEREARRKQEEDQSRAAEAEKAQLKKELAAMQLAAKEAERKAHEAEQASKRAQEQAQATSSAATAATAAAQAAAAKPDPAVEAARQAELQKAVRLAEQMATQQAALRVAEQVEAMRAVAKREELEREQQRQEAEREYQLQLRAVNAKLDDETRVLRTLQAQLDKRSAEATKPRILSILRDGESFALGMVEVAAPAHEKSLAHLRALIVDEIDLVTDDFVFVLQIDGARAPLTRKQESKKLLGDLPANQPVVIRISTPVAPPSVTSSADVPVAPSAPPMAPPCAPPATPFLASPSSSTTGGAPAPPRADLLSSIREGRTLKKTEAVAKPAPAATSGLTSLLSAALATRRHGVEQEDDTRGRADSWDAFD